MNTTEVIAHTHDRLGADLHVGDTIHDLGGDHRIDHFGPYPGRFIGGRARIAYYVGGGERTVCDRGHFTLVDAAAAITSEAAACTSS